MPTMQVGQLAPPFTAPAFDPALPEKEPFRPISLNDYADRWLALVWYPEDFTHVCPTELTALSDRLDDFKVLDCAVLGASTDSVHCHRAWAAVARDRNGIAGIRFPLLSDKTQKIARSYGVLVEEEGIALRGLFIIDPDGKYLNLNKLN